MSILGGKILTLKDESGPATITWQQNWLPRRQRYSLCQYSTADGKIVPVYIQSDYSVHKRLTVNPPLQYGQQNGVLFFVHHNKEQKPYQHRFMKSEMEKYLYAVKDALMVDLTVIVGNYLNDVEYTQAETPSGSNNVHEHNATGMSGGMAEKAVVIGKARDVVIHQHLNDKNPPY